MSSSLTYRPDIDGLRSLAVVPVVLFHAGVSGFGGGFVGVDIFFVISGFLITSIIYRELSEGRFSIVRFYERRARRILPALFAVVLATLVAGWFILPPGAYENLGRAVLSALLFVSNIWFWQSSGGYFDGATDYLPMLHTWSLAVEEQFYIFFPLLLMFLHRIGRKILIGAVCALVVLSFAVSIPALERMPSATFYLLPTRIWELGAGAVLAVGVVRFNAPRAIREVIGFAGLAAVILPIALYDAQTPFPGLAALPPVAGAAALIWAGTSGPVFASRLLALRPLVWVGLISYSFYLWHWPIMSLVRYRFASVELEPLWQVSTVLASLAAAWLSWRFIEKPFRISARDGGMNQRQVFAVSGIGIASFAAVSIMLVFSDGATKLRFSDQQLAELKTVNVGSPERRRCDGVRAISELCDLGEANAETAPRWMLWGDSHAGSMLPSVIAAANQHDRRLIFANKGNCPSLPKVRQSDMPKGESDKCAAFREDLINFILANDQIETVFLVSRWPLYGEGGQLASEGHRRFDLIDTLESVAGETNPDILYRALARLSETLTTAGKNVVVVETVPEIPWHVARRIRSSILFGFSYETDLVPRKTVLERQAATNTALRKLTSIPGVSVIRLVEELCDPACKTRDGNQSFYRDSNHVNVLGASTLVSPILDREIDAMMASAQWRRDE